MKANKKLLASAMALGLAGLTTVGSTYAWFTANGQAQVTGIQMTAKSDVGGIYVANEGASAWNDNIALDDFAATNQIVPCTSADGKNFYKKVDHVDNTGDGAVDTFKYEKLNSGTVDGSIYYIETKMHIAVSVESTMPDKIVVVPTVNTLSNAMGLVARVAVDTTVADGDTTTTVYDFSTAALRAGVSNDAALTAYNKLYGLNIANKASTVPGDADYMEGYTAETNFNVTNHFGAGFVALPSNLFSRTAPSGDLTLDATTGTYYYTTLTFRFWLEGNDYSCYNAVATETLSASMKFTFPSA